MCSRLYKILEAKFVYYRKLRELNHERLAGGVCITSKYLSRVEDDND